MGHVSRMKKESIYGFRGETLKKQVVLKTYLQWDYDIRTDLKEI